MDIVTFGGGAIVIIISICSILYVLLKKPDVEYVNEAGLPLTQSEIAVLKKRQRNRLAQMEPEQDPTKAGFIACDGKDHEMCESFATFINLKGKGCYSVLDVQAITHLKYRVTCELASYDRSSTEYLFKFTNGMRSYVVY